MKKLSMLILMIMFLSACSSARPVIRSEEPAQGMVMAENQTTPDDMGEANAATTRQNTFGGGLTMTTDARTTRAEKTKPEQMISASEKDVAINNLSDTTTQPVQTKPTATDSGLVVPTPEPSTQPPASITSQGEEAKEIPAENHDQMSAYNLFDYYPLVPNRATHFDSDTAGPSTQILQYLYEERGKATAQIKRTAQDGEHLNVIRIADGQMSDLYYTVQTPYRSNIIGWTEYEERIVLKEPLQVGNRWESTGLTFEIVAVDEKRIIRDEAMTVLDVLVTGGPETLRFTYAVGFGLVASDIVQADGSLINLISFAGLVEEAHDVYDIDFYFPAPAGEYLVETVAAPFHTNDAPKDIITQIYKRIAASQGHTPVFGESGLIQYIFLEDEIARVDLNDGFISFINEAPELESARIQSLVNTISQYFEAKGVILTVNDQRYESAQLMFASDEVLTPDLPAQSGAKSP